MSPIDEQQQKWYNEAEKGYNNMKFITVIVAILGFLSLTLIIFVFVQSTNWQNTANQTDNQTAQEVAEGKVIFEQMQSKEKTCTSLSDEQFASLGEYYMDQMVGTSHQAMNTMMEQMMGKASEEQMHVVMGKRLSGCNTSAAFPSQGAGLMPMMGGINIMGGNMMNLGFMSFGWVFMILWWVLIIVGIVVLVRWLAGQGRQETNSDHEKSPLEILKERYAKGEIDKKEFEDKKRDLS